MIIAFVFAKWIAQFLYFPNPKFPASNHLLCLYSWVCVRPVQKPHCWFSHDASHLFSEVGQLVSLDTLDASDNSLCYVPLELRFCTQLKVMSLDRNKLTWLPRQLCNLHFLEELSICGNSLEFIPQSKYNHGQIYSYMSWVRTNTNRTMQSKKKARGLKF